MLAFLYLVLSAITGYNVLKTALPQLFELGREKSLFGKPIKLAGWMVTVPASFLVGTLAMTWSTYLWAYGFRHTPNPMLYGNLVSFSIFLAIAACAAISKKRECAHFLERTKISGRWAFLKKHKLEMIFVLIALAVSGFLMFYTFNIRGGIMNVGLSVFGDFGFHLAMIRSFSRGANFPTEYAYFPDGTIRYHFFFQFLAGNLEFLGMPLDWAFNLPSILSYVSFLMLLYSLAVVMMGEKWIGILTAVLFFFRSSFAFFTYLADMTGMTIGRVISKILANEVYIGKTTNESYGIWTQNVFINQRHFAFSLGMLMLVLILVLPLFKKMIDALKKSKNRRSWLKEFLLEKDAWMPENIERSAAIGTILGLLGFWHGTVVIAAVLMLLALALFSKHRLEHAVIIVISMAMVYAETIFFMGPGNPAVQPTMHVGFLSAQQGILAYYVELLGILPFVLIAALIWFAPARSGKLALAFFMPFIFANLVRLTPYLLDNSKFINITIILLNIMAANFLYRAFQSKSASKKIIVAILLVMLTVTGLADFIALLNLNNNERSLTVKVDDPLTKWVEKNTDPNEIFLTDTYHLHPLPLSGRKIFYGWPVFAMSAGYDTYGRNAVVNAIYGGTDIKQVRALINRYKIGYIVIDDGNRNSQEYKLNEELIKKNFKLVYRDAGKRMAIYKT